MLVDPTGTFPKVRAAGLTVSAPEGVVFEFVEVVELLRALVTPVHPDWVRAAKIVANTKRAASRRDRCDGIGPRVTC